MDDSTRAATARPTLYTALGGREAVAAAVHALYTRLLDDPSVGHYFDGMDMLRLNGHMRMFLTTALGDGANERMVTGLGPAHARLGITDHDFDVVAGHLAAVLEGLGVDDGLAGRVLAVIAPLRAVIVADRVSTAAGGPAGA